MQNFIYDEEFYHELEDLIMSREWDEDIDELPDDFKIEIELTTLEPIVRIDAEWVAERIDIERFSDNNEDREFEKVCEVLDQNIDFEKVTSLLPKLHYGNRKKETITKQDIINYIS